MITPKASDYPAQLADKRERIESQFKALFEQNGIQDVAVFESEPLHFRMRAEFRIWHDDGDLYYVMFDPIEPKTPIRVDDFPIASRHISDLMEPLRLAIKAEPLLSTKLFQLEFLSSSDGEVLVSLIYHQRLDEQWQAAAVNLQNALNIKIIGRSRKQKVVLSDDFITETLTVDKQTLRYQQVENSFTQPNAGVNQKMLSWAKQQAKASFNPAQPDLVELYCGNGNFTAVLAGEYRKVLATEISKTSVKSAQLNFKENNIANVEIARMSAEEFTEALEGKRQFRRLAEIELSDYDFGCIFVDPPRAGIDTDTLKLCQKFETILYISCNPNTLQENIQDLAETHKLIRFAMFDQFPYSHHIECGALLQKRA